MATYDPRQTFKAQQEAYGRASGVTQQQEAKRSTFKSPLDNDRGSTYDEVPQVLTKGLGSRSTPSKPEEKTFDQKIYEYFVNAGATFDEPEQEVYALPVYESPMFRIPTMPEVTVQGIKDPFDQFNVNPFRFGGYDDTRDEAPQATQMQDPDMKDPRRGLMSPPTMDQPDAPEALTNVPRALAKAVALPTAKYTIQDGDTLSEIAEVTGSTVQELADLNMINKIDVIRAGAELEIPIRTVEDKATVTNAKSMEELKPIKASYKISEPSLELDTTDPDAEFYSSFTQGITPPEMMQTTGDDTYVSADYMSELEILARTIEAEAGGESKTGKLAVGSVIKNRADQNRFGNDIRSVILFPQQFSPWNKYTGAAKGEQGKDMLGETMKPSKDSYEVAKQILSGKYIDPTGGATHFVNPKVGTKPSWYKKLKKHGIEKIGQHEFGSPDNPNWRYSSGIDESLRPKIRPQQGTDV